MRSSSPPPNARRTITIATSGERWPGCRCRASPRIVRSGRSSFDSRVPRIAAAGRPKSSMSSWRSSTASTPLARCTTSWSGASVLAEHQRDAVRRATEIIDRIGGVILADEPGLGKSLIAAEIARCEEARGATVEVIVPASLVGQWNETRRRFGVTARITTHDGIVSDCTLAEPKRRLLIVDEAHAFRNPRTQRYDALARRS